MNQTQGTAFVPAVGNQWLAVGLVAIGAFTIVASEFLPVGILTQLSQTFGVTEGFLGLSVALPGFLAALTAPIAVFLVGTLDRKFIVVFLSMLTALSCLIAGLAGSVATFLFGRALLGIAIGGFWSFAIVLARRLVTLEAGHRAAAVVGAGISLGTVLGLPLGSFASAAVGWRASFYVVAALSTLVGAAQLYYLPSLKTTSGNALGDIKTILQIRKARYGFLLMGLAVLGHFSAYTYMEPYLRTLNGITEQRVTYGLLLYGACGFIGTFAAEFSTKRFGFWATFLSASLVVASILLLASQLAFPWYGGLAVVGSWGILWGVMPTLFSIWLFEAAPQFVESTSGIFVLTVQLALSFGSFIGGRIFDAAGIRGAFGFAATAYATTSICLFVYRYCLPKFRRAKAIA